MTAPMILAVDTATEVCSVSLLADQLLARSEVVGQKHSERVLPMVDDVLRDAGCRLPDIDAFAFGAGPGSFTGLRIACGVVQGLAYGCARPVVGVCNLRALAYAAAAELAPGAVILTAIDARMHEVYCAVYRNDEDVSEVRAPALERPDALESIVRQTGAQAVTGNALSAFPDISFGPVRLLPEARADAALIARLARGDFLRGRGVPAADATPLYVRDRVALTVDERLARVPA